MTLGLWHGSAYRDDDEQHILADAQAAREYLADEEQLDEMQAAADKMHERRDLIYRVLVEQLGDTLSPRRLDRVADALTERISEL